MEELYTKSRRWREGWILGGDFNDIRCPEDKRRERIRSMANCKGFREFIGKMNIIWRKLRIKGRNEHEQITGIRRLG